MNTINGLMNAGMFVQTGKKTYDVNGLSYDGQPIAEARVVSEKGINIGYILYVAGGKMAMCGIVKLSKPLNNLFTIA